eukprot:NODE_674_length_4836_cov_1.077686.p2 type:complete len:463 gc:universal NODE_674_length_4836_cov_1.077686:563-1951(+)
MESSRNYVLIDDSQDGHQTSSGDATILSSIINICNTILGSGMLLMPFAFAQVGWGLAIVLVIFSAFASGMGMWLLTRVGILYDKLVIDPSNQFSHLRHLPPSFYSLAAITYPPLARFFDIAIGIKCLGVSVSYLIVIGQYMPELCRMITTQSLFLSKTFWVFIAVVFISPLAFKKRLNSLKTTSTIALISVVYLVVLVSSFYAIGSKNGKIEGIDTPIFPKLETFRFDLISFLHIFPAFVFAFTCHQNVLSVYNELQRPTSSRLLQVISVSIISSCSIYAVMGYLGYSLFGESVSDNIVLMFPKTASVVFAKISLVFLFIFSFPLQSHPARDSFLRFIDSFYPIRQRTSSSDEELNDLIENEIEDEKQKRSYSVTVGILIFGFVVASTVDSLDKVLTVVGASGSTTISFILPGMFYVVFYQKFPFLQSQMSFLTSQIAYALSIYGILVVTLCLGYKFISYFI